jgi:hypothetical protein
MEQEKIFANGLIFKAPRPNAPEFVKGSLSIKVDEFVAFLTAHNTNAGWVNIDIKESKGGKLYCELNTYKPDAPKLAATAEAAAPDSADEEEDVDPADIPF